MARKNLFVVAVTLAGLVLLASPASAQDTGYQLDNVSESTVAPGGSVTVHANGFGPNSTVTITLSPNTVVLATVAAGSDGVVRTTVTIPSGTAPGDYTIEVSGVDADGNPKTVTFSIVVSSDSQVLASTKSPSSSSSSQVLASTQTAGSTLATTGTNIGLVVGVAAIAIVLGAALLSTVRRRESL